MIGGFGASRHGAARTRRAIARARSSEIAQFSGMSQRDGQRAGTKVVFVDEELEEVAEEACAADRALDARAQQDAPAVQHAEPRLVLRHELARVALVLDL